MMECLCRTEEVDCRLKRRCRTNFSLAFRHLHVIFQHHTALTTPAAAVYSVYHFPLPSVCSVDLRGILFIDAGMSNCPASNQPGIPE
jgi:hypothetical protein